MIQKLKSIKLIDIFKKHNLALCFIVPLFILCIYQLFLYIFGKFTFVANDCFYQYVSFYKLFYDKVLNGGSFASTFTAGLGIDFYSIYCYYLSSPLNFLIFLFPIEKIGYAIASLIILKVSLCGLTFGYYLKHKFNTTKNIVLFSCIWCFSGYFAGYLWNIMWLDVLILFPLLILFMEDLVYKKEFIKYTLVLTLTIISNYFLAYICCIFLVLKFFTLHFKNIKDFFLSGIYFAICSLLSGGIAGMIVIPSYFILKSTTISGEQISDFSIKTTGKITETLSRLMFGEISNAITSSQVDANIHVSLFVLLLFGIYLFSKKINLFDKIANLLLIGLLVYSFNSPLLQFIWHGMHKQNGIPNRFAFLFIFIIITCSFEVLSKINKVSTIEKAIGCIATIFFITFIAYSNSNTQISFVISVILIFAYTIPLLYNFNLKPLVYAEIITFFIISTASTSIDSLASYNKYYYDFQNIQNEIDTYSNRGKYEEIGVDVGDMYSLKTTLLRQLREYEFSDAKNTFKDFLNSLQNPTHKAMSNEGIYYGVSTPSLFNTFMYEGYYKYIFKSGSSGSSNTVSYAKDNVVNDMLLGIKYSYIRNDDELKDCDNFSYKYLNTYGNIDVYENKYSLGLGYLIDNYMSFEDFDKGNQFELLNNLMYYLCGEELFTEKSFEVTDTFNCDYDASSPSYLKYQSTNGNSNPIITLEYESRGLSNDYLFFHCNELEYLQVFINNELQYKRNLDINMMEIGELQRGDSVKIELVFQPGTESGTNIFLYSLNQEAFKRAFNKLNSNTFNVAKMKDGYLKGSITKEDNKNLLLTIPYDKNWKVKVNGKVANVKPFAGAFMYVELENGENIVEMEYHNSYILYGFILSIISIGLFALFIKFQRKLKNSSLG